MKPHVTRRITYPQADTIAEALLASLRIDHGAKAGRADGPKGDRERVMGKAT